MNEFKYPRLLQIFLWSPLAVLICSLVLCASLYKLRSICSSESIPLQSNYERGLHVSQCQILPECMPPWALETLSGTIHSTFHLHIIISSFWREINDFVCLLRALELHVKLFFLLEADIFQMICFEHQDGPGKQSQ